MDIIQTLELVEQANPYPVTIQVCGHCGLSWEAHLKRANNRTRELLRDLKYFKDHDGDEPTETLDTVVLSFKDCIALLKIANQGPPGATGAQGPMGVRGTNG